MGVNYFALDYVRSTAYGVLISKAGAYNAPARVYESISVPGKNGDVLFDEGRYENVVVSYECGLVNDDDQMDEFRAWLLSHTGYCRIEDSYHPGEYRLGMPINGLDPEMLVAQRAGKFKVEFNCKPQRFLTAGNTTTTLTASGNITNPTLYPAKPLLRVYGYGTLKIGSDTITIAQHSSLSYIDLDCDIQDAYYGSTNANSYITLSGSEYPTLKAGINNITLGGSVTRVIITPRWWTL